MEERIYKRLSTFLKKEGDNMMAIEEKSNKYMFKKVEGELYGYS